jgi:hypothetical protein
MADVCWVSRRASTSPITGTQLVFHSISDQIADEMLRSVVTELDFGERTFVDNFLRHELEC